MGKISIKGEPAGKTEIFFSECPPNIRTQVINGLQVIMLEEIGANCASPDLTLQCFHCFPTEEQLTRIRLRIGELLRSLESPK